jgi:hypothetical protein
VIPDLRLSVTGTWHRERNQYGAINTGVPTAAYSPVGITDPGPDGIAGTADDQQITAYNQDPATFGHDQLFYTNNSGLDQNYHGIEITANKRFSNRWLMLAGYTYGHATQNNTYVGQFGGQLNNPNTQINSKGVTFYDRPQTFKLTGAYMLPWDVQVSGNLRTQSGTAWSYNQGYPFRVLRANLAQGSTVIFADTPGAVRTPTIKTVDARVAKIFHFGNNREIEGSVDVYNIFNQATPFDFNPFTGTSRVVNPVSGAVNSYPSFGLPTGLLGPRIVRFGAVVRF